MADSNVLFNNKLAINTVCLVCNVAAYVKEGKALLIRVWALYMRARRSAGVCS